MFQHTKVKGVAEEYTSSLTDLTVNSKPLINMLTMLAEDYIEHAPTIVRAVEAHLQKVNGDVKLPVLYLIDSIVKNVGKEYVSLFTQNIVSTFCNVFEQVDEKTRSQMFKLRQTWNEVFPPKKLYALDARVNAIDPAWPITANPPHGRIHVNPKFLNPAPQTFSTPETSQNITDGAMREELLKKQKELLELQKRKVELELLQTKAILEEQQKKLENQTANFKTEPLPSNVEKLKTTPEVAEPFPSIKIKNSTDVNRDNKSAFESSRVRDPRLRLKKVNTKRPNDPTFNIPERIKSGKINVFNEENSSKYSEENRNVMNSEFNGIKRSERSDRRNERRQKKYKEHKSRPKPVSDVHTSSVESNRSKVIANELIKHKELLQTVVDPTPIGLVSDKSIISNVSKDNDNKGQEVDKAKTKSSPSKSRTRNKIKDKIKRKVESPSSAILPKNEETSKNHAEPHSTILIFDETSLHSRNSVAMDVSMEVEENPPLEESKSKEYTPLIPQEETIIPSTTCSNDTTTNSTNMPAKSNDLALDSFRDIDLRLLPQSKNDPEQPPEKKSKGEMQKLFGEEDVDLRKFPPPTPPTPPPPVISNSLDLINDVEITNGWANFKRSSTDTTSPNKSPNKSKKMKHSFSCSKVSFFNKEEEDPEESSSLKFSEQESEGRSHSYCFIMKQAEEQLQNETITFSEYNQILKGVMSMNEERKLQEAILKDEMEMEESPGDAVVSSGTSESVKIDKDDSYNPPDLGDEMKCIGQDNETDVIDSQYEKGKNSNEVMINSFSDHGSENNLRKRGHFKDQFHRGKEPRHRYYNSDPYFVGKNVLSMMRPPPPNFVHRPPRKEMMFNNRWPYQNYNRAPFDSKRINFNQLPRMRNIRHPHEMSLPSADPNVLEMIKNDPMTYVNVGRMSKEIRFYGENAIIMLDWDDPRDLMFQPGSRRVFIDGVDMLTLQFNSQYREITLTDGVRIRIRLGAPTRELFIDGRFYDVKFGGPAVEINLGGRNHLIQLEGPLPFLKIGTTKRTDLVAGKVNLIVDGNIDNMFPVYLDAKPQRFEIGNVPFIIRFVEALQTVVINGQPFKSQFGGLPVAICFRGEKHFLRLTSLPPGIVPGYVNILNMEGGRLPTPPPPRTPPPPQINGFEPSVAPPGFIKSSIPGEIQQGLFRPVLPVTYFNPDYQLYNGAPGVEPSVDVLTSLMTPPTAPNFSQMPTQNYVVEPSQENTTVSATPAAITASTPDINVTELYKKLVAIGAIVPPSLKEKEKENTENRLAVKPVDFSKPETLKVKQPGLINRLYSGIQCSSCGVRFAPEQTVKHSQHLDWHFRQNRRERHSSKIALSRKWNYDVSDWIQYQEIEDLEDRAQSWFEMQDKKADTNEKEEKDEPTVPAKGFGENPCCTVCRDKFDQFFNEEKEEWQLKMAICMDEKLYHPLCYKDEQESEGRNVGEMLMNIQEELHSIETIVIDDSIANGSEDERKIDVDADSNEKSQKDMSGKTESDSSGQTCLKNDNDEEPFVPAMSFGENPVCVICSEKIEKVFCEEKKELFLKPAICMNDKLYHPHCFKNQHENDAQLEKMLNEKEENNKLIETIVVDDSITIGNEGENVEEIELETVNMSTDEPVQEVAGKSEVSEDSTRQDDSDDDILEIEVLKPNIESYEILDDDDDDDEEMKDETLDLENAESNSKDRMNEMDTSGNESESDNITVKTEKIDLVNLNLPGNPSHVTETISLDGNSEFSAPTILLPKKIKINISSIIQKNSADDMSNDQHNNSNNMRIEENSIAFNNSEPLPPGEELYPAHLKPRLVGKRLAEVNAVNKGKELSGLCSIM